jgi:P-type conjugative transfer protein TrbJ
VQKTIILLIFLLPTLVFAGGDDVTVMAGGDATEFTQHLNNLLLKENVGNQESMIGNQHQMLSNQAEMLARQLTQINNMVQNTKTVSNPQWSNTSNLLKELARVVQQGQALSYAGQNIDERFKQLYPGYQASRDFSQDYRNWSNTNMDSIRGALNSANLQANDFATEDSLINQLQNLATTTQGRMQAIQVGNMIAMENVQQMRKLRQLQMAHMQAQNNYLAKTQQEDLSKKAVTDNFFKTSDPTAGRKYKGYRGGSK